MPGARSRERWRCRRRRWRRCGARMSSLRPARRPGPRACWAAASWMSSGRATRPRAPRCASGRRAWRRSRPARCRCPLVCCSSVPSAWVSVGASFVIKWAVWLCPKLGEQRPRYQAPRSALRGRRACLALVAPSMLPLPPVHLTSGQGFWFFWVLGAGWRTVSPEEHCSTATAMPECSLAHEQRAVQATQAPEA